MTTIYFASDKQESPIPRRHALESAGYRLRHFTNSATLLAAVKEQRPQLVIVDDLLPGVNGFEVCRILREGHAADVLPLILCTGIYRSRVFREEAERLRVQSFLLRPVATEDFLAEVMRVLGHAPGATARGNAA